MAFGGRGGKKVGERSQLLSNNANGFIRSTKIKLEGNEKHIELGLVSDYTSDILPPPLDSL